MIGAFLSICAPGASIPKFDLAYRVVRSYGSLEFLAPDLLAEIAQTWKPEQRARQLASVSRFRNWVVDETGRYAFSGNRWADIVAARMQKTEVYIKYEGAYVRWDGQPSPVDPMADARPLGLVRGHFLRFEENPPKGMMLAEASPFFSKDGRSALARTGSVHHRGWTLIAELPSAQGRVGGIRFSVHDIDTVVPGSTEGSLFVTRPGGVKLWSRRGLDLPPRPPAGDTLLLENGRWISYRGLPRSAQTFNTRRRVAVEADHVRFAVHRFLRGRIESQNTTIPDPLIDAKEPSARLEATRAYILPSGKKALVTLVSSYSIPTGPRDRLYAVVLNGIRWKKVADGVAVYGASASGRYLLVGGSLITDPGMLLEVKE